MALKNAFITLGCATVLAWSGLSLGDEYHPHEFLGLDLSTAVLSPKPLGPPAGFAPGPLDVTVDRGSNTVHAIAEPAAEPKTELKSDFKTESKATPKVARKTAVKTALKTIAPATRVAHLRAAPPHLVARTKLAHHRNPLDAQAFDARIQIWPCKTGGICNWKR
ncbi:MAG TPA: hypothetical protein VE111_02940 [Bradyrhizobium sp.]|nr:hypothetical protein [Bradyrhizobium sp.]